MAEQPIQTSANDTPSSGQSIKKSNKRKLSFLILLAIIIIGGVGSYLYYALYSRYYEETDNAYVNGNLIVVTPQISGIVTEVVADEGDYVLQGQTMVLLDPHDTEIALQNAEASLAQAVRQVRGLYSNVDSYRAQVEMKQVAYAQATDDYNRRQKLSASGAISQEDLLHYRDTQRSAKNDLIAAQKELATNIALVDDTIIESHPEIKAAIAQLRQSYLNNQRTTIVAPVSGYVAKRVVQVGSHIPSGTSMMAIVPKDQIWIDANFKENQMQEMRIGQPATITVDLYGDKVKYRGKIESLGMGTGSAFALLPAQNASGNWIKIVQRLPVRIQLDGDNLDKYPLRIGLSSVVSIDLHDTDGLLLPNAPTGKPRFSTNVYQDQMVKADQLVESILHDNGSNRPDAAQTKNVTGMNQ
ncbi:efflux RND transporter periplasmic adaptor subunit [Budvicia diplopodorum]|uniref:HlyD family secretion protein n=1 Tax=Budvicia diplopodorum TaxID=1119056 RepID=UPI00135BCC08|nr:efflux RND transporter periplasmic adaptor subunit [Budvicia diplopodorum]